MSFKTLRNFGSSFSSAFHCVNVGKYILFSRLLASLPLSIMSISSLALTDARSDDMQKYFYDESKT